MTTTPEIDLTPGNVKAAMRAVEAKSSDLWKVKPQDVRVIEGFNVRTEDAEYLEHIAQIKKSIKENGFRQDKPLTGYVAKEGVDIVSDVIYLTDGHTRLRAVLELIAEGTPIEVLPVIVTPAGTSMADLCVGLVTSNSGKALRPHEIAEVCKRLTGYGLEEEEIASRLGKSEPYIRDLLRLAGAGKSIKAMVAAGQVNAANAIKVLKKAKSDSEATQTLRDKLEAARNRGKGKVTTATLQPKRDLVADGVAWIRSNAASPMYSELAGLLSHITGAPHADIAARLGLVGAGEANG
ncbi:hypothetical protein [uncultured Variovorax sp.]|uniref:ParB/RepB/Spo0J family partition protein n=1 Tax=uncultured Variovorax sp. TaxID=114708 RepID=UPI0025CEFC81|nr:hypothetical protein [uncultured Variovorax sp.]